MNQSVLTVREVFHSSVADHRRRALEQLAQTWLGTVARREKS